MFNFGSTSTGTSHVKSKSDDGASFIGVGCTFTGNLDCQSSLRVEGIIKGNITGSGDIEVAATGQIEGDNFSANNLIVYGKVRSNIKAKGYLRIHKTGHVEGDINVESLDIEAGAHFVGYSQTGHKQSDNVLKLDKAKIAVDELQYKDPQKNNSFKNMKNLDL
jgi:cytoskeletal protein CcmA (bactofilin family)